MTDDNSNLPLPGALRRGPRALSSETGTSRSQLAGVPDFLLAIEPEEEGISLLHWARSREKSIEDDLFKYGAILFRGFAVSSASEFQEWMHVICGQLLSYDERSSPRSTVEGSIYTSTEYPAARRIPFHNESSYSHSFPGRIAFWCVRPAATGGETPIAHTGRVLRRLPTDLCETFRRRRWSCVRNYRLGLGMSWQQSFQCDDPEKVEEHCIREGLQFEWLPNGGLRTTAIRDAFARRPQTDAASWFNHVSFFHASTLDADLRYGLVSQFGPRELPANTFYGDGDPIPDEVVATIREAYAAEAATFAWRAGDVLLLDNLLVSHSRSSFTGDRQVLVAMAEPLTAPMVAVR